MNKIPLIVLIGISCGNIIAAESSVCPRDVEALNAPGIVIGTTTFECDSSPVPPGHLNECGMLKWAAQTMPAYLAIAKDHQAFISDCRSNGGSAECDQGKFSAGYLFAQLKMSIVELKGLDGRPPTPPSLSIKTGCELVRRGVIIPVKPKDAVFLSDRFSFTRSISDPQWSRGKPADAPFILYATKDREKDKSAIGIYGTIGYNLHNVPGDYSLTASAKIDSAAGAERKKSSVALGLNWSKYYFPESNPWIDSVLFRVSPEYLTDRAFDREAYQLTFAGSLASERFGRPGFIQCPGGCDVENTHEFYWLPSFAIEYGKVVDAAGSDSLLAVQQNGSYTRLAPSFTMTYKPVALSPKLSFQLDYVHRFDLDAGWDRGLGTLSMNYAIAPNVFWNFSWRKGQQDATVQPIDTFLFGIGIRQ